MLHIARFFIIGIRSLYSYWELERQEEEGFCCESVDGMTNF